MKLYQELIKNSKNDAQKKEYEDKLNSCEIYKQELEETLVNEKNIIRISHKNCLKIKWFGDFSSHYVFISDICENKDMASLISNLHNTQLNQLNESIRQLPWIRNLSESFLKYFTYQMISMLECLKEMRLIHGNIQPTNILLTKDFKIKLTDFSCSRFAYGNDMFKLKKYEHEIDIAYQPPEYFREMNYLEARDSHKIDIFSFACCLYEMGTGESLFKNIDEVYTLYNNNYLR